MNLVILKQLYQNCHAVQLSITIIHNFKAKTAYDKSIFRLLKMITRIELMLFNLLGSIILLKNAINSCICLYLLLKLS